MDRQLQLFSATLESWRVVQRGWLQLEAVFGAPDIQRQVPAEAAAFAQVRGVCWACSGQCMLAGLCVAVYLTGVKIVTGASLTAVQR